MKLQTADVLYHRVFATGAARAAVAAARRVLPKEKLETNTYEIALRRVPTPLDGHRLLHLSDLHLDDRGRARRLAAAVQDLDYDLAVLTGDFINDDDGIELFAEFLSLALIRRPALAVFGNHDHWALRQSPQLNDLSRLRDVLIEHGIRVLVNEHVRFADLDTTIVGVDDPVTGNHDLAAAMDGVSRDDFVLLLAHTPEIVRDLDGHKPDLILSGHAHGGQVRLPMIGPVVNMTSMPRAEIMGVHTYDDVVSFVHRGVGYSGVKLRYRCDPEIAMIVLRTGVSDD